MSKEHGFLVIDKPAGMTSHDVVAQLRKRLGTKQVGHAGTLDPMATGVLVVGINNATKFLQYIVTGRKRYNAIIRLGISTVTDDREGEVIEVKDWRDVTDSEIESSINKFRGTFMQVPSSVSAKKIAGERAYDLVREGKEVELAAKEVTIHDLKILAIHRNSHLDIDIDVACSAGTYIRSIARDLGAALGVGGHLIELRRTEVAPFELFAAGEIASAEVLPLASAIAKVLPIRNLGFDEVAELKFGRRIEKSNQEGTVVGIAPDGEVAAILENREGRAQPVSVFNS
ncbi:MAG: tRNA pseudouridine(55) synthase TruB [Candidatus Nanopelagicaceae bacterium]|nr:tRNA pseudouridine(55) synthase TruB [Candidatus Nanopelagicaceae bacterium]